MLLRLTRRFWQPPHWQALLRRAPRMHLEGAQGYVYLLADPHLDSATSVEAFIEQLRALPQVRLLLLMGDLFSVWLASPRYWNPLVRKLMKELHALKCAGMQIVFVIGNRDLFFPPHTNPQLPFTELIHELGWLHWQGRNYLFTHGDLINRQDGQYLLWKSALRSGLPRLLLEALPARASNALTLALERRMAQSNQKIKFSYPEAEVLAFAHSVLAQADACFVGHFHIERRVEAPPARGAVHLLPAWLTTRSLLRMDAAGTLSRYSASCDSASRAEARPAPLQG